MSKFRKKSNKGLPPISTAALPDIIFMLLFFFMVSTTMRETELFVSVKPMPEATEVQKLEKKSLVSFIYVGPPMNKIYGTEPRIQLNDQFATLRDIPDFVTSERESKNEADRPFLTTSLKIKSDTKMGIVSDIKQELRKSGAYKINYSSRKGIDKE